MDGHYKNEGLDYIDNDASISNPFIEVGHYKV